MDGQPVQIRNPIDARKTWASALCFRTDGISDLNVLENIFYEPGNHPGRTL